MCGGGGGKGEGGEGHPVPRLLWYCHASRSLHAPPLHGCTCLPARHTPALPDLVPCLTWCPA